MAAAKSTEAGTATATPVWHPLWQPEPGLRMDAVAVVRLFCFQAQAGQFWSIRATMLRTGSNQQTKQTTTMLRLQLHEEYNLRREKSGLHCAHGPSD